MNNKTVFTIKPSPKQKKSDDPAFTIIFYPPISKDEGSKIIYDLMENVPCMAMGTNTGMKLNDMFIVNSRHKKRFVQKVIDIIDAYGYSRVKELPSNAEKELKQRIKDHNKIAKHKKKESKYE